MKRKFFLGVLLVIAASLCVVELRAQDAPAYQGVVGKTLADSKEWWASPAKPPAGAPNVVWIILDDVGFGASSAFGGVIRTPTFDSLANNGLRYTNFHTCAICAPTRSALLTGRNSHFVHEGGFSHISLSAGFPGYDGRIPSNDGTIAEILRQNGYNTYAVGKYGLTPDEDATDVGPFDRWPTGKGFDHFFGFLGSQTDQYKPDLVEDNAHVTPDGRHLNEQITDKAISYLTRHEKIAPGKPFFLYYSPGATHAPHQVDKYWSDQYKGKFDEGWDIFREKVLANQKKLGIVPAYAQLPARNARIQAWNALTADQRKLFARFMEVYAGYLTYTDYQIGRLVNFLKEAGQLDNTLIFVIIGDNGASKEGTVEGVIEPKKNSARLKTEADYLQSNLADIDSIGTAQGFTNYPLGWAQAANTPFREWKQDADAEGGTHNPLIAFYPKGIRDKGGIRPQYGHVIDLLPTTLELVGLAKPEFIRGIKQDSVQGTSLAYSFNDGGAASRHLVQHYYIFGSRSIYYNGWKAEAAHHPDNVDFDFKPGQTIADKSFDEDVWELYNLNEDFNERVDLAKKFPEKLADLKKKFDEQAEKNHLYPLISWYDVYNKRIHHPNGSETQALIK
ncbi:arylsulfatase [Flavitalea sp. BT771]|uniref:arylsulfatase n=1 Tax=Flavitalea sp. BT771 TaxID=3063329 RepID=UPI0026E40A92|nr:arylsulfatase [Flavitalea sp. BT771]MDO6429462.1 arylsulfatase [Flavitalea sp. BT771]MDV6218410.1 arylsulfatase [Flavitalea sp. BT771]